MLKKVDFTGPTPAPKTTDIATLTGSVISDTIDLTGHTDVRLNFQHFFFPILIVQITLFFLESQYHIQLLM